MNLDEKVLSYGDSLLRASDVALLEEGRWLNDKIIGFVYEYFEREQFKSISKEICLVSPEVTQFIKLSRGSDEVKIFLEPLELEKKKFIFFPVNDNQEAEISGGSHWSLLVYCQSINTFKHFDSFNGSNIQYAIFLKEKVKEYLKGETNAKVVQQKCPQQRNGYDCGIFVICFTEEICRMIKEHTQSEFNINFDEKVIKCKRTSIRNLIESLSKV